MFYGEDLAHVHDVGFAFHAIDAGPFVLETLRGAGIGSGDVLEIGCGSGLLAEVVAGAGFAVHGSDLSAPMIDLARARVPGCTFEVGSYLDLAFPPCDAVVATGEVFNYTADEGVGPDAVARVFKRVGSAVRPGGVFVFDAATPGRCPPGSMERNFEADDRSWAILLRVSEVEGVLTRDMTVFVREGELYRRSVEVHRLRLYEPEWLVAALDAAGFDAVVRDGYGRTFPPGLKAFIATKR